MSLEKLLLLLFASCPVTPASNFPTFPYPPVLMITRAPQLDNDKNETNILDLQRVQRQGTAWTPTATHNQPYKNQEHGLMVWAPSLFPR